MRLDTGNRSFLALLMAAAALATLAGMAACSLLGIIAWRVSADGLDALTAGERDLRPALAVLAVLAAGTVAGGLSLRGQLRASKRLAERLRSIRLPATPELEDAAARTRLRGRIRLVDALEPFSFTYGAVSPRVAVSRGLLEAAEPPELEAVLAHERYHVRNLDPLKVVLTRALGATFFLLPAVRDVGARYVAGRELAADRRALRACGRAPLAGALLKVVRGPDWSELRTAAAIGGPELLDVRVAQLELGSEPPVPWSSRLRIALTALVLTLIVAGFVVAVVAAGGFAPHA